MNKGVGNGVGFNFTNAGEDESLLGGLREFGGGLKEYPCEHIGTKEICLWQMKVVVEEICGLEGERDLIDRGVGLGLFGGYGVEIKGVDLFDAKFVCGDGEDAAAAAGI